LSFPRGRGINQYIPAEYSYLSYLRLHEVYAQLVAAGVGCLIIKRDEKDAFRMVPVALHNQLWLGFRWDGAIYIECCLPFGLATAPLLFNLFAGGHPYHNLGHRS
jgi:hypothetical protein